nr:hypothetical protein Iba_chr04aCG9950 [Ipomoea batatas]
MGVAERSGEAGWLAGTRRMKSLTREQEFKVRVRPIPYPYQLAVSVSQVGEHTYSSDDSDLHQIMAAPMSHLLVQSQAYNSLTEMC